MPQYSFTPIGFVRCDAKYPQETPRQGVFSRRSAVIELTSGNNFEAALNDLAGVTHIWLIWIFDRSRNWKPLIQPPTAGRKVGVFATRSPHRPNPIGITAAKLLKIEGLKLHVENIDLLDGTPVLDIKPYVPQADAFPDARISWLEEEPFTLKKFNISPAAENKAAFIKKHGGPDLLETARVQLATRKIDSKRQRIDIDGSGRTVLSFRTWRIRFTADDDSVLITDIFSGYSSDDIAPGACDIYHDLDLHRIFTNEFGNGNF